VGGKSTKDSRKNEKQGMEAVKTVKQNSTEKFFKIIFLNKTGFVGFVFYNRI